MNIENKIYNFKVSKHIEAEEVVDIDKPIYSTKDLEKLEQAYLADINVVYDHLGRATEMIKNNNKTIRNLATVLAIVLGCVSILAWRLFL